MLVATSGKINSGKDLVGEIIQIITSNPHFTDEAVESFIGRKHLHPTFKIMKFADTLKDIVCLLLGCTREQLEDREYKEKELGEEWWYCKIRNLSSNKTYLINTIDNGEITNHIANTNFKCVSDGIVKLTPRKLLQLLGTECGREILHPNIWVNALFSKYKPIRNRWDDKGSRMLPDWVITDMRFPNELQAIEDRKGVTIRVNRPCKECKVMEGHKFGCSVYKEEHTSETALDQSSFHYTIKNTGSILELIAKVREILVKECII